MLQFSLLERLHECRQGPPSLLHQPTSFHLQITVPNSKLLEKSGSAWKAMDDHSRGQKYLYLFV